jgi:hypothetical protein
LLNFSKSGTTRVFRNEWAPVLLCNKIHADRVDWSALEYAPLAEAEHSLAAIRIDCTLTGNALRKVQLSIRKV